ncbi:hypothetical protein [Endozoicomonas sp. 4G]|uniref:hypothetical protein n=1 Tax=Endozoicomonas sp. 4G TaxID=2872754 RepID=UPI002078E10A|nr:hypothetical protein [Endozoicomonas sp. 4G]
MKTSGKRILLLSCLLFICSAAHSGLSKEEKFHLLSHNNNATLIEYGWRLFTVNGRLGTSTLISYGLWYSICKAPGVVAALRGRFELSGTEQNELQQVQSSFCNQLAAVLTSTEIALAGRVSPWPLQTPWWQPLRFVGTAYGGYVAYKTERDPYLVPIITADYLTGEMVTRTVAEGFAIWESRHNNKSTIQPLDSARAEYSMLSSIAGSAIGVIVYDRMIARDASRGKAVFAYLISLALLEKISSISSRSIHISDGVDLVGTETGAEDLAATGALAGSWATAIIGSINIAHSSDAMVGVATIVALNLRSFHTTQNYTGEGMIAGVVIGGAFIFYLKQLRSRLDANDLLENIALTLSTAFALVLINGFSNNLVYGYSLEESFNETTRTQLQKFYAPLDYLHTLFN